MSAKRTPNATGPTKTSSRETRASKRAAEVGTPLGSSSDAQTGKNNDVGVGDDVEENFHDAEEHHNSTKDTSNEGDKQFKTLDKRVTKLEQHRSNTNEANQKVNALEKKWEKQFAAFKNEQDELRREMEKLKEDYAQGIARATDMAQRAKEYTDKAEQHKMDANDRCNVIGRQVNDLATHLEKMQNELTGNTKRANQKASTAWNTIQNVATQDFKQLRNQDSSKQQKKQSKPKKKVKLDRFPVFLEPIDKSKEIDKLNLVERINKSFGNTGSAIAIETTANHNLKVIFQKEEQTTEEGIATWLAPMADEYKKLDTTTWYPAVAHGISKVDGQSLDELKTHIEQTNKVELACNPRPLKQTTVDNSEKLHYSVTLFFKKAQDMITMNHQGLYVNAEKKFLKSYAPKTSKPSKESETATETNSDPVSSNQQ
jgi:DNA repair exonuclease SbcCD ATPase subunit